MIEQHIKVLNDKMQGLERRLFLTRENLSADQLITLTKQMESAAHAANFLVAVHSERERIKNAQKTPAQLPDGAIVANAEAGQAAGKTASIHKISEQL